MRLALAALAGIALAGCQSAQTTRAPAGEGAHLANAALSATIRTCWFSGDPAFAEFSYAPEANIAQPRILIVPKKEPGGRPALVIEPKGGGVVEMYGPLLQSASGARISADVARWRTGSSACS